MKPAPPVTRTVTIVLTRRLLAPWRTPERLLEPLRISWPHLRIDDARRALAVERHDELLGGDPAHIGTRLALMPAVCGLAITLSNCKSGWSDGGGSLSHTSSP